MIAQLVDAFLGELFEDLPEGGGLGGYIGAVAGRGVAEFAITPVTRGLEALGIFAVEKLTSRSNGDVNRLLASAFTQAISEVRDGKKNKCQNRRYWQDSVKRALKNLNKHFKSQLYEFESADAVSSQEQGDEATRADAAVQLDDALLKSFARGESTSVEGVIRNFCRPFLEKELKNGPQEALGNVEMIDELCSGLAEEFFVQVQHLYKNPAHKKGRLAIERDIASATLRGIDAQQLMLSDLSQDQKNGFAELRLKLAAIAADQSPPPDWTPNFRLVIHEIRQSEANLKIHLTAEGDETRVAIKELKGAVHELLTKSNVEMSLDDVGRNARSWPLQRDRLLAPTNYDSPANCPSPPKLAQMGVIGDLIASPNGPTGARHTLLSAPACFGKTVMMSMASKNHRNVVAAVYFIRPENSASRQLGLFVQTVAAQLERLVGGDGFNEVLRAALSDGVLLTPGGRVDETLAGDVLEKVLASVSSSLADQAEQKPFYLLIDGIDELGAAGVRIGRLLRNASRWSAWPNLRIVATAQPSEESVFAPVEGWQIVSLGDDVDVRLRQRSAMRIYADRALPTHVVSGAQRATVIEALVSHVNGNFLLLNYLINNDATHLKAGELTVDWISAQPAVPDSYFQRRFTRDWFQPQGEEVDAQEFSPNHYFTHAQRLLSLLLAQRTPTSIERLARAAADKSEDLWLTVETIRRMHSCLAHRGTLGDRTCRILFEHDSSMRSWLTAATTESAASQDGTVDAFRREVGVAEGHALWSDYSRGLTSGAPTAVKIEFLTEYGLFHACRHAQLVARRTDLGSDSIDFSPLSSPVIILDWIYRQLDRDEFDHLAICKLRLPRLNRRFFSTVRVCDLNTESVTLLNGGLPVSKFVDLLVRLLTRGANEIPALAAPLRVLARMGFAEPRHSTRERVRVAVKTVMTLVGSDQLLSRYALGRAMAEAYWGRNDREFRKFLMTVIRGLRKLGRNDYDAAEAAAYCSKFLWSRGTPPHDYVRSAHQVYGRELAESDHYNMRMAYGESLIERACDPVDRLNSQPLGQAAPWSDMFWKPVWPYHQTDLAEAVGARAFRLANGSEAGVAAARRNGAIDGLEIELPCEIFANEHQKLVNVVYNRLGEACAKRGELLINLNIPDEVKSAAKVYWQTERVLAELEHCDKALHRLDRDCIYDCLWPFVLHPVWEVTEGAASLLGNLREERSDDANYIIQRLADCRGYWQAQYAALDAAYNSHASDQGKIFGSLFAKLVGKHFDSPHRRVRFICAEDSFLWYQELFLAHEDVRRESDPDAFQEAKQEFGQWLRAFGVPLEFWMKSGDDCTLLDETFQFVQDLLSERKDFEVLDSLRGHVATLAESGVTSLLHVGRPDDWWTMPRAEWLESLDREKRTSKLLP